MYGHKSQSGKYTNDDLPTKAVVPVALRPGYMPPETIQQRKWFPRGGGMLWLRELTKWDYGAWYRRVYTGILSGLTKSAEHASRAGIKQAWGGCEAGLGFTWAGVGFILGRLGLHVRQLKIKSQGWQV